MPTIEHKYKIGDAVWHIREFEHRSQVFATVVRRISYSGFGLKYQCDGTWGVDESELFPTEQEALDEIERRKKNE